MLIQTILFYSFLLGSYTQQLVDKELVTKLDLQETNITKFLDKQGINYKYSKGIVLEVWNKVTVVNNYIYRTKVRDNEKNVCIKFWENYDSVVIQDLRLCNSVSEYMSSMNL